MTNRMQRVRWEDPPAPTQAERKRRQPIWAERLEVLKTRPGVWGHVHTMKAAQAAVTSMRLGKVRGVDPLDYELTSRVVNGSGRVYAKYIGHLRTEEAMPNPEDVQANGSLTIDTTQHPVGLTTNVGATDAGW